MECLHSKFVKAKSNYSTCTNCGILLKVSEDVVLPVSKDGSPTYSDLNWLEIYKNMKSQAGATKIIKLSDKYIYSRRELIDYIKSLNYKFKFSDITLHLAVYLMDIICSNENIIERNGTELIAVACLFLSC
jgi:hypothetical protein